MKRLDESEIQEYVLRKTMTKDKLKAIFKGKSLCIPKEDVKMIGQIFEKMAKKFFRFVGKQNDMVRKQREIQKTENRAHSMTAVEYLSAFKAITEEQIQQSNSKHRQFEQSHKKDRRESSSKKQLYRSNEKKLQFIQLKNSASKLVTFSG